MTSIRRIQKELAELARNPLPNVSVGPSSGDDLTHWEGVVTGPVESPFSNGLFKITIDFPADYPFKPPKINFSTKIYHPNIDQEGAVCLALLKTDTWKPATKVTDALSAMVQILAEPNPDDPLVPAIAEQYRFDYTKYVKTAKEWVLKYAE